MTLTGDDTEITSPDTPHSARYDGNHWRVSWAPGRDLTCGQAMTAMVLACAVARDEPENSDLWLHVAGWADELGLTAEEAIGACRQPPLTGEGKTDA